MSVTIAKPKLNACWFCEQPKSAAALSNGRAVCAKCAAFMAQGVICIGVTVSLEPDTVIDKIYRDGNWCVLSRDEYMRRFRVDRLPELRFAFVMADAWKLAALPRAGKHGASHMSDSPETAPTEDWSQDEVVEGEQLEDEAQ